jgi:hypothetical protein
MPRRKARIWAIFAKSMPPSPLPIAATPRKTSFVAWPKILGPMTEKMTDTIASTTAKIMSGASFESA